ncbi:MAG: hypothetical protein RQ867_03110 [Mariprofundaceae bacterium]|nr:hypothetical protein [Mariprofundaceae bacterium]
MRTIASLLMAACLLCCSAASQAGEITISKEEATRIGELIFYNECAGDEALLTSWNLGEGFPSLGIGHFIWYPAGSSGPYKESFPELIRFIDTHGVDIPGWLEAAIEKGAPWLSRNDFLAAQESQQMQELRTLLSETRPIQTEFMIRRLHRSLPRMLASVPHAEQQHIQQQFERVAATPMGHYALVDYVNFKGEGTQSTERYQGKGWGLLQVLQGMQGQEAGDEALTEFADAALAALTQRVKLAPPGRNEERWLSGWTTRINTYRPGASSR